MYNTHIKTTISMNGFVIFIEYSVTEEWAVEWWLDPEVYANDSHVQLAAIALLAWYLRCDAAEISAQLMTEFESRQYAQEQAEAAKLEEADVF